MKHQERREAAGGGAGAHRCWLEDVRPVSGVGVGLVATASATPVTGVHHGASSLSRAGEHPWVVSAAFTHGQAWLLLTLV